MARSLLLTLAILGLLAPATVQAQSVESPILEDAVGDLAMDVQGSQPSSPPGDWKALDVVGLHVTETADDFTFAVQFADLAQVNLGANSAGSTRTYFSLGAKDYLIEVNRPLDGTSHQGFAALMEYDAAQDRFLVMQDIESTTDIGQDRIAAIVPRQLLDDGSGAPPSKGHQITGIYVESTAHVPYTLTNMNFGVASAPSPLRIWDRMPDAENGTLQVQIGSESAGHVRLSAQTPFRASNGEAGTFIYKLRAENTGTEDDLFRFEATDLPMSWRILFPSEEVQIGAGQAIDVPVLAILPFAHDHGSIAQATIRLSSLTDPTAFAEQAIGVRYLAIPQPAGHHDTLFVHTLGLGAAAAAVNPVLGGTDGLLMMNTQETYPSSDATPVHGYTRAGEGGGSLYGWNILLEPQLEMGLDFDLQRLGSITASIDTVRPMQGATLSGRLLLLGPTDVEVPSRYSPYNDRTLTVLANLVPADPVDLSANQVALFKADIAPTSESDLIPFVEGQSLVLELFIEDTLPATYGLPPQLRAGAFLNLPLNEYSDPVTDGFDSFLGKALQIVGPREKLANPGEAVSFELNLKNPLPEAAEFVVTFEGAYATNVSLAGSSSIKLDAGESRTLQILARVPADVRDGERLDFVVQAEQERGARTLLRLAVIADVDQDHADESSLLGTGAAKESPTLWWIALAGLGMAAVRKRR